MLVLHATTVDLDGIGVVLRGPSGSGKSDLALRLIDQGARLVSDDGTNIAVKDGRLLASPPETIRGKLEVRGLGIVEVPYTPECPVALIVDLVPLDRVERMPEPETESLEGIEVPSIRLCAFEVSAMAKIRMAIARGSNAGKPAPKGPGEEGKPE